MSKVRRVDFSPDEYISGVAGVLNASEQGVYWMICSLIMSEGGPVERNEKRIATLCGIRASDTRKIINRLVEIGKISEQSGGKLAQKRAQSEVELASKRIQTAIENGSKGGRPSKKDQQNQQNSKPDGLFSEKLSPTTNYQLSTTNEQQPRTSEHVYDRLIKAASSRGQCHPSLALGFAQISDLLDKGYDLEKDVLPIIRERAKPEISSWAYFVKIIISRKAEREAIPEKAKPKPIDWPRWIEAFNLGGIWKDELGPKPGEPGCLVPPEFLGEIEQEGSAS